MSEIVLQAVFDNDDLVMIDVRIGNAVACILAHLVLEGSTLTLRGTHVDGPGANLLGPATLKAVVRRMMEIADVETVVIEGAIRTTGAGPGRIPYPIRFRRSARRRPA